MSVEPLGLMSWWTEPQKRLARFPTQMWNMGEVAMWVLSTHLARQWFGTMRLVTDARGKRIAELLGLPFDEITTELEGHAQLAGKWPVWALGKLVAYTVPDVPFVHFDHDVFMVDPLPAQLTSQPVFAQSPEHFVEGWHGREVCYPAVQFLRYCATLPASWLRALALREQYAYNVGVFGGHDLTAIREYATEALQVVADNPALVECDGTVASVFVEQFPLGVRYRDTLPTLYNHAFPNTTAQAGYVHHTGSAKRKPEGQKAIVELATGRFPMEVTRGMVHARELERIWKQ